MKRILTLFLSLGFLAAEDAAAQPDPNFALRLETQDAAVGSKTTVRALLDNAGESLSGWSFGVCHDANVVEIESVAMGAQVQALNGGAGPDFNAPSVLVGTGWTVGVAVGIPPAASAVLPLGSNQELHVATYIAESEGVANVDQAALCPSISRRGARRDT